MLHLCIGCSDRVFELRLQALDFCRQRLCNIRCIRQLLLALLRGLLQIRSGRMHQSWFSLM